MRKKKSKENYPFLRSRSKRVRKVIKELVDFDYLDQLSDKELAFLNAFVKEEYTADFRDAVLTTDIEDKRRIYRQNNARNRDSFIITKATSKLAYSWNDCSSQDHKVSKVVDSEDALNRLYDLNNSKRKSSKPSKK